MSLLIVGLLIFVPMLAEAARAAKNERAQRMRGGIEPPDDVYGIMRIVYPAGFLAMLAEGGVRLQSSSSVPFIASPAAIGGLVVFLAGKIIKWSAILTLGPFWTFRVIVVPGTSLVGSGPYRYLRHPNYVGVVGELVGAALMTRAVVTGPLIVVAFLAILRKRIEVEERALSVSGT
jgi:methyltransferase